MEVSTSNTQKGLHPTPIKTRTNLSQQNQVPSCSIQICQFEEYAGGANAALAMATSLCVCSHVHAYACTHMLIVELSNFTNKCEMETFIPCSLYSGSDDQINSQQLQES